MAQALERSIACLMAVLVVEALEAVQVEHHDTDAEPAASRPRELDVERLLERASVQDAGERIGARRRLEPAQHLAELARDPAHHDRDRSPPFRPSS